MNQTIRRIFSRPARRWSLAWLGIVVLAGCGQPEGPGAPEPAAPDSASRAAAQPDGDGVTAPTSIDPASGTGSGGGVGDWNPGDGAVLEARIPSGSATIQLGQGPSRPLTTGQAVRAGSRVTTGSGAMVDLINPILGLGCRLMADSELTVTELSIVEPEQAISKGTHINTQLELSKGSLIAAAPRLTADSTLQVWTPSLAVTGWKNARFQVNAAGVVSVHPGSGSVSAVTVALPVREFPEIPPGNRLDPETGSIAPESSTAAKDWTDVADGLLSELGQAGG